MAAPLYCLAGSRRTEGGTGGCSFKVTACAASPIRRIRTSCAQFYVIENMSDIERDWCRVTSPRDQLDDPKVAHLTLGHFDGDWRVLKPRVDLFDAQYRFVTQFQAHYLLVVSAVTERQYDLSKNLCVDSTVIHCPSMNWSEIQKKDSVHLLLN